MNGCKEWVRKENRMMMIVKVGDGVRARMVHVMRAKDEDEDNDRLRMKVWIRIKEKVGIRREATQGVWKDMGIGMVTGMEKRERSGRSYIVGKKEWKS
jgi:hypothetical protein